MKVLLYLYYPFFDDHLAGGVQVWLRNLVTTLQQMDKELQISIYCPDSGAYHYPGDVEVNHVLLDMEQDFLTPRQIHDNLLLLQQAAQDVDVIWTIDRAFPVQTEKPLLLSLNTICYEREVMSIFQGYWNYLIVPSDFVRDQLVPLTAKAEQIFKIPYYVDPIFLRAYPDKHQRVRKYFPYDERLKYILFPHRPDRSKGNELAMQILKSLLCKDSSYRLLVPKPPIAKAANAAREAKYIQELQDYAVSIGIAEQVIFHAWVDYSDIPSYYSIGEFTLFFSRLPETFGLSLLNSVICGTPTISFGSGALGEIVPGGNGHVIIEQPQQAVDTILQGKNARNIEEDINFLKKSYNLEQVAKRYLHVFRMLEG